MRIDFDGLGERVTRVPVEADNLVGLEVTKEYLVYARAGAPFYGRDGYPPASLVLSPRRIAKRQHFSRISPGLMFRPMERKF